MDNVREVAFWQERELNAFIVVAAKIFGHIREGGLCRKYSSPSLKWPLSTEATLPKIFAYINLPLLL